MNREIEACLFQLFFGTMKVCEDDWINLNNRINLLASVSHDTTDQLVEVVGHLPSPEVFSALCTAARLIISRKSDQLLFKRQEIMALNLDLFNRYEKPLHYLKV